MSFVISKIAWFIINPVTVIVFCFFAGTVLLGKFPRFSRFLIILGMVLLLMFSLPFLPVFLMRSLESRVRAAKITEDISGVIALAGMIDIPASRNGRIELLGSIDRAIDAIILIRQYPKAQLVFTGGSGSLNQSQDLRESDYLRLLAISLGVDSRRIIVERDSRATYEHPKYLAKIIDRNKKWVLVTSAAHMPRALLCFQKYGFNVLPYPVDYQVDNFSRHISLDDFIPSANNLFITSSLLHEWYGLVFYRLMGYTTALLPK